MTITSSVSTNSFFHVVVTYNGGTTDAISFYIDGQLSETRNASATGILTTATNLLIGANLDPNSSTPANFFNGLIDDVRIYNYARTAEEIRVDYNAGLAAHFGGTPDLTRGLVGQWNFDEMSGTTAKDKSGNGNDGTLTNNPRWTQGPITQGLSGGGGALDFDGVNDSVSVSSASEFNTIHGAISFWINPTQSVTQTFGIGIVVYGFDQNNRVGISFRNNDKINVRSRWSAEAWPYHWTGDTADNTVPAGQWTHVVLIQDGVRPKVYINGVLSLTVTDGNDITTWTDAAPALRPYRIGREIGTEYFNGQIDDVRVYNRALSSEEIRYLYNNNGPIAYWRLDEGSGSTAYDATGNNNDGTLINMATSTAGGWTTGKYGSALEFDENDDFVDVSDSGSEWDFSAFTASLWAKPGSVTGSDKELFGDGSSWRIVLKGATSKWQAWMKDGSATAKTTTGSTATAKVWIHLVEVFDGSNLILYENGVEVARTTGITGLNAGSNNQAIGKGYTSSVNPFDGLIDDVRIYNYVRTSEQIRVDYNSGLAAHFGGTPDLTRGLVGHWKFDEMSGTTAKDKSGNGNDGTLTNNPKWTQGPTTQGLSGGGGSLDFDGVDDYVDAGDSTSLDITDDISLTAWIKPDNVAHTGNIVAKILGSDRSYRYYLSNDGLAMEISSDGTNGEYEFSNTGVIAADVWHHVVAVKDGTIVRFYVDGVAEGTGTLTTDTTIYSGIANLRIGSPGGATERFNGNIDDARIYNRALSSEEIRYLYNNNGPIGYWRLDEGSGSTAFDATGSNNDGTLTNMATSTAGGWAKGKFGNALSFNSDSSNDDYVIVNPVSNFPTTEFTITLWGKGGGSGDGVISYSATGLGGADNELLIFSQSNLQIYLGGVNTGVTGVIFNDDVWHHISVSWQSSDGALNIYKDGVLEFSGTHQAGDSIVGGGCLVFAQDQDSLCGGFDPNQAYPGLLDDIKIYNYVRTQGQILADYNAGLSTHFR